jgi:hypothetical protein
MISVRIETESLHVVVVCVLCKAEREGEIASVSADVMYGQPGDSEYDQVEDETTYYQVLEEITYNEVDDTMVYDDIDDVTQPPSSTELSTSNTEINQRQPRPNDCRY